MTTAAAMRAARVLAGLGIYWRRRLMEPEDRDAKIALEALDALRDQAMIALEATRTAVAGLADVAILALEHGDEEVAKLAHSRGLDAIAILTEGRRG